MTRKQRICSYVDSRTDRKTQRSPNSTRSRGSEPLLNYFREIPYNLVPHSEQKLWIGGFVVPQWLQETGSTTAFGGCMGKPII